MNRFTQERKKVEEMMVGETDQKKLRRMRNVIRDIQRFQKKMDRIPLHWNNNPALVRVINELHNDFSTYQDRYSDYINNTFNYSDSESDSEDE